MINETVIFNSNRTMTETSGYHFTVASRLLCASLLFIVNQVRHVLHETGDVIEPITTTVRTTLQQNNQQQFMYTILTMVSLIDDSNDSNVLSTLVTMTCNR